MAIRKLKRAAASRLSPSNRPAAMLTPDRLIPGKRARTWAMPIASAPRKVIDSISRTFVPQRSASHRIAAPTQSMTAT